MNYKNQPHLTDEMNGKLKGLNEQLKKIKSPAADIPHINTKGVKSIELSC